MVEISKYVFEISRAQTLKKKPKNKNETDLKKTVRKLRSTLETEDLNKVTF